MNYDQAVAYMSGLLQFGIRLDRERFATLLSRLGDPHQRLRCVHVAGTNGKGSTTTFIAAILRAAGYRTGAYFSPYVFDLRERIQIDGRMISRDAFAAIVSRIHPEIEWILENTDLGETTEFELKTAAAFCYFAEQQVDFAVIEVGIGGRLDATNVIEPPLVAVITSIGLDHVNLLGDTLAKIAREKAGILKTGTICVTGVEKGEARDAIAEIAAERAVPLLTVEPDSGNAAADAPFAAYRVLSAAAEDVEIVTGEIRERRAYRLGLKGAYQAANAATAIAAIAVLRERRGIAVSEEAVAAGLADAYIPGRFEVVDPVPDSAARALILDGAHNEDGAQVLSTALRARYGDAQRYTFVVGSRGNHPPAPFLRIIAPLAERIIATEPAYKPTPAEETAQAARALKLSATIVKPAGDAVRAACADARSGEIVVVTGSLYTVGETPADLRGPRSQD